MSKPKHAVVLFTTPPGWEPTRVHSLPPSIVAAEYLQQSMTFHDAIKLAKEYNRAHLPCRGTFEGRWAVVIKNLKPNWTRDPKILAERRKGGVA